MSIEQILIGLVGLVCAGLGWFARELYQAVEKLKEDVLQLEVKIGTDFVRYDRLQDMLKPIMHGLDEIKDALKTKADK
jgi:hypothetical protein